MVTETRPITIEAQEITLEQLAGTGPGAKGLEETESIELYSMR